MRRMLALAATLVLFAVGCGESFTEDEIAGTLDLRFEGSDNLYATSSGDCIVTQVLTSKAEIEEAEESGELSEAVATNPDETAGVVFGGYTSVDPDTCAESARSDLEDLTGD